MLTASITCFPNNVVNVLALAIKQNFDVIDPSGDTVVVKRPLSITDPDQCIGVTPVDWKRVKPVEMGQKPNRFEVPVQEYTIMIQALINDADEDRASARHSLFSTLLRNMLYRDEDLVTVLTQLEVVAFGIKEHLTQYELKTQSFVPTKGSASYNYLSVIEFAFETQTT